MPQYTHGHHDSVLRSHRRRTAADSAAYLLAHLRPTDRLPDVGAGPGTITADLAGFVAEVVATEIGEDELALTREDRAWWGGMWADRILHSAITGQLRDSGAATAADLQEISDGWRAWAAHDDGWFAVLHGEILCRV